jgi:hypothetical protein
MSSLFKLSNVDNAKRLRFDLRISEFPSRNLASRPKGRALVSGWELAAACHDGGWRRTR